MDASRGGRAKEDEKRLSRGRERKKEGQTRWDLTVSRPALICFVVPWLVVDAEQTSTSIYLLRYFSLYASPSPVSNLISSFAVLPSLQPRDTISLEYLRLVPRRLTRMEFPFDRSEKIFFFFQRNANKGQGRKRVNLASNLQQRSLVSLSSEKNSGISNSGIWEIIDYRSIDVGHSNWIY